MFGWASSFYGGETLSLILVLIRGGFDIKLKALSLFSAGVVQVS